MRSQARINLIPNVARREKSSAYSEQLSKLTHAEERMSTRRLLLSHSRHSSMEIAIMTTFHNSFSILRHNRHNNKIEYSAAPLDICIHTLRIVHIGSKTHASTINDAVNAPR